LPFIDLEGTRSSELARRAGISKQAVAKGVRELEAEGLLSRVVDSADARASLVCFTEGGINYLLGMHQAISDIETEYDALIGKPAMDVLRVTLLAMIDDRQEVKHPEGAAFRSTRS
jgi:DNA-binding MarR family transcriptional regulator